LANMNEKEDEYPDKDPDEDYTAEETSSDTDEFNVDEYLQDDSLSDYGGGGGQRPDDDEDRKEMPIAIQNSFFENLQSQLDLLDLNEKEAIIGQQIIGSLDDDGYLRRPILSLMDDLAFSRNVIASEEEVEGILAKIQRFDPAGVAARDLQECLLIQLRKKDLENPTVQQALL